MLIVLCGSDYQLLQFNVLTLSSSSQRVAFSLPFSFYFLLHHLCCAVQFYYYIIASIAFTPIIAYYFKILIQKSNCF